LQLETERGIHNSQNTEEEIARNHRRVDSQFKSLSENSFFVRLIKNAPASAEAATRRQADAS